MKRLVFDVSYEGFWRMFFSPHEDKVEVLEAIRSFKCDIDGFAIICKIRLKDKKMKIKDFMGNGVLTNIETLYEEKEGSKVVYMEGNYSKCAPFNSRPKERGKVVSAGSPEFVGVNKMRVTLVGKGEELLKQLKYVDKVKLPHKILSLTTLEPEGKSQLSRLSEKQRKALLTAYGLGYYDVPRRISSEEVAGHLNLGTSTLVEHLRKAEKRILAGILAE